jgi:uncharacterized protein YeaO (DUF488 family)
MPERARRSRPLRLKRVYERPSSSDGMRVLVDRLWPRGLSRQRVSADLWLRDAAPSAELRRWYGHDRSRWSGFRQKYRRELSRQPEVLELLDDLRRRSAVTLMSGTRDVAHSHAAVLLEVLDEHA